MEVNESEIVFSKLHGLYYKKPLLKMAVTQGVLKSVFGKVLVLH